MVRAYNLTSSALPISFDVSGPVALHGDCSRSQSEDRQRVDAQYVQERSSIRLRGCSVGTAHVWLMSGATGNDLDHITIPVRAVEPPTPVPSGSLRLSSSSILVGQSVTASSYNVTSNALPISFDVSGPVALHGDCSSYRSDASDERRRVDVQERDSITLTGCAAGTGHVWLMSEATGGDLDYETFSITAPIPPTPVPSGSLRLSSSSILVGQSVTASSYNVTSNALPISFDVSGPVALHGDCSSYRSDASDEPRHVDVQERDSITLTGCAAGTGHVWLMSEATGGDLDYKTFSIAVPIPPTPVPSGSLRLSSSSILVGQSVTASSYNVTSNALPISFDVSGPVALHGDCSSYRSDASDERRRVDVQERDSITLTGCAAGAGHVWLMSEATGGDLDYKTFSIAVPIPPTPVPSGSLRLSSSSILVGQSVTASSYNVTSNALPISFDVSGPVALHGDCSSYRSDASDERRRVDVQERDSITLTGCAAGTGHVWLMSGAVSGSLDYETFSISAPEPEPSGSLRLSSSSILVGENVTASSYNVTSNALPISFDYSGPVVTNGDCSSYRSDASDERRRVDVQERDSITLTGCAAGTGHVWLMSGAVSGSLDYETFSISAPEPEPAGSLRLSSSSILVGENVTASSYNVTSNALPVSFDYSGPVVTNGDCSSYRSDASDERRRVDVQERDSITLTGCAEGTGHVWLMSGAVSGSLDYETFSISAAPPPPDGFEAALSRNNNRWAKIYWTHDGIPKYYEIGWREGADDDWPENNSLRRYNLSDASHQMSASRNISCGSTHYRIRAAHYVEDTSQLDWGAWSSSDSVTRRFHCPPTFVNPVWSFKVNEHAKRGTVVGQVRAIDHDRGNTIVYSIISGNEAGKFAVNSSNGEITLAGELDRSIEWSYSLTLHATDGIHGGANTAIVEITVRAATNSVYGSLISIGSPIGTTKVALNDDITILVTVSPEDVETDLVYPPEEPPIITPQPMCPPRARSGDPILSGQGSFSVTFIGCTPGESTVRLETTIDGEDVELASLTITVLEPPPEGFEVNLSRDGLRADLRWTHSGEHLKDYQIEYRHQSEERPTSGDLIATNNSYTSTSLGIQCGDTEFKIRTRRTSEWPSEEPGEWGTWSAAKSVNRPCSMPTHVDVDSTFNSVTLTWTAPEDPGVTSYKIERRDLETGGEFIIIEEDTGHVLTIYEDKQNLEPNTSYEYRVQSIYANGGAVGSTTSAVSEIATKEIKQLITVPDVFCSGYPDGTEVTSSPTVTIQDPIGYAHTFRIEIWAARRNSGFATGPITVDHFPVDWCYEGRFISESTPGAHEISWSGNVYLGHVRLQDDFQVSQLRGLNLAGFKSLFVFEPLSLDETNVPDHFSPPVNDNEHCYNCEGGTLAVYPLFPRFFSSQFIEDKVIQIVGAFSVSVGAWSSETRKITTYWRADSRRVLTPPVFVDRAASELSDDFEMDEWEQVLEWLRSLYPEE